ncbi:MAG TPA: metal-binding protein [Cyanobacteria bacterium UBA8543]|nr:metal-binding protein [Cyanobacteria bacterium UBA8543]
MTKTKQIEKLDLKTFGDWSHLAIQKHFQKTIKYETDVLKDKDPEALHQMRVGMRRLRTAVTGFAPALDLPKATREKKIGKIARELGELRDLDVLKDTLENQYLPALPPKEQKALKKVLAALEKQRQKTLEQVQETLKDQNYQQLKRSFKDWIEKPTYGEFAEISIDDILPDVLLPLVSKLLVHPGWLVGVKLKDGEINIPSTLNSEQVEQLLDAHGDSVHSLRKEAKRVRYQMELFTEFYGSTYADYVNDVKEIQSILGHIQDSFVLAEFLRDTIDSEITVELPALAAQLTASRYQSWQEWQPLQLRYLNPQTRKDLHQTVLQPLALDGHGEG